MLALAELLGDPLLDERPTSTGTNPVGALVLHCCAVTEFWLGHVALGRPDLRDRDGEFVRTTTPAECNGAVAKALVQTEEDLHLLQEGAVVPHTARAQLHSGAGGDDDVVLHVIEEVFQHLGQMEVTKDVLLSAHR